MPDITRAARARRSITLGALAVGPILITVGTALSVDDSGDGVQLIRRVASARGRFYVSDILFALGLALVAVGLSQVYRLAPRRGAGLTTGGGIAMQVGMAAAASGMVLYASAIYVASDPRLDQTTMGRFQDIASKTSAIGWPFMGFMLFVAGAVVLGAGLIRARTIALWQPILLIVGAALVMVVSGNGIVAAVAGLPLVVALVSLARSAALLPADTTQLDLAAPAEPGSVPFPREGLDPAARADQETPR